MPRRPFQYLMLDLTGVDTDSLLIRLSGGGHFSMIPLRQVGRAIGPKTLERAFTVVITSIRTIPSKYAFEVAFTTRENLPRGVRSGKHVLRFHPDNHICAELPDSFFEDA